MSENNYSENLDKYSDFIKVSLKDLVKLTVDDKKTFLDLYYNRVSEFNKMQSILKNIRNRGDNILILAHAGTGKSSFMYKVFYEIENLPEYKLYPIIIDYRDGDKDNLYSHFINEMDEYFKAIDNPINNLSTNIEINFKDNFRKLKKHLANLTDKDFTKHLIILLDDFDYLKEDDLFEVLEVFQGFGVHTHATLVLSARPELFAAIKDYDNRLEKTFTKDIHKIPLLRLDIEKLISKRLAALIIENINKSWWQRLMGDSSSYIKLLNKMGISNITDLTKIHIPFTGLYLNFISTITNQNNRDIFDIVHDSLIFVLENYDTLESVEEKGADGEISIKKDISKENTLKLFCDNENSSFKIININNVINKKGNSLLFNLLEGIKLYEAVNVTFLEKMKELGHKEKEITWGIKKLKKGTLISPTKLIPSNVEFRVDLYPEYIITNKGDYYMTVIAYWECYISRYGKFGTSLNEIV